MGFNLLELCDSHGSLAINFKYSTLFRTELS